MILVRDKKIVIKHRGPIKEKAGVYGPILTPYVEKVSTIWLLINSGKKVFEVDEFGREYELNFLNYNRPLGYEEKEKAKVEEVKKPAPIQETKDDVVSEPVEEPKVDTEPVSEEVKEEANVEEVKKPAPIQETKDDVVSEPVEEPKVDTEPVSEEVKEEANVEEPTSDVVKYKKKKKRK